MSVSITLAILALYVIFYDLFVGWPKVVKQITLATQVALLVLKKKGPFHKYTNTLCQ